jgi:hypothetical protein
MTRRDANWLIARAAATTGASSFLGPWLAAGQVHEHSTDAKPHADPHNWNGYQPKFFSQEEFVWLGWYTAILIPTDETPGAHEANVTSFIDFVVNTAKEFAPEVQEQWRSGMAWLGENDFGSLSPKQQEELITAAAAPEKEHTITHSGYATYRLIKEMAVRAFYTSRVGLIDVLEYKGIAYLAEFPACNHPEHQQV